MDLRSVEVRPLLSPQVVPNLHNGLQPLRRPLGEVVKAIVVLIGLHGVKPGELLCRGRAHPVLRKLAKMSDYVGPPIRSYLEDSKPKVLENLDEERVQREPHSELEIALRKSHVTIRRSMWPLQISRLEHLETILSSYLCTVLRHNQRLEVAIANRYFLHLFIALAT